MTHPPKPYLGRMVHADGTPLGTCFQVSPGVVVTAWHVVRDADVLVAPLSGGPGARAVVHAFDEACDLAVLTCDVPLAGSVGLVASDSVRQGAAVAVCGFSSFPDVRTHEWMEATGSWQGRAMRGDGVAVGRLECRAIVRGMSGAPVRLLDDDRVVGVVSERYNSESGWLRDSVWVARTEDLMPLLAGVHAGRLETGVGGRTRVQISAGDGRIARYREVAEDVCYRLGLEPVSDGGDILVLLVAHRYWPHQERAFEHASTVYAYLVDDDFPWPPSDMDLGSARRARDAFASRVRDGGDVRPLAELADFRADLFERLSAHRRPAAQVQRREIVPAPPAFHTVPAFGYQSRQPFTGRAADLAALDDWAASADPVMVVEAIGGTGKSALTWHWANERAADRFAGRLWWSFYEGSASMSGFLHEATAYTCGLPLSECAPLGQDALLRHLLAALRSRPYLLVLDGFERMLAAYHRIDPSKLLDDEVDPAGRGLIDHNGHEVLRALLAAGPSKTLISSRLMPASLEGLARRPLDGVRRHALPGLARDDVVKLVRRLGITTAGPKCESFFTRLGNHPLLVGVIAGRVRDYARAPEDFDRWLDDPQAGGALRLQDLDLKQRRTHVLAVALDGLSPDARLLLGWLSVLSSAVGHATLEAINPFEERARLDRALSELEHRGLLWWVRRTNTYDLHPVVRAYAHDQLQDADRVRANERVRDHFSALPAEDLRRVTSVEDLQQSITMFRALVGSRRLREAEDLYHLRLDRALAGKLSATTAIIELLEQVARPGTGSVLSTRLAWAYQAAGRFEDALPLRTVLLEQALNEDSAFSIHLRTRSLYRPFRGTNRLIEARRALDLADLLDDWALVDFKAIAWSRKYRASLAICMGDYELALELLGLARVLSPRDPELASDLLRLRVTADVGLGRFNEAMLAESVELAPNPLGAAYIACDCRDFWMRRGALDQALEWAETAIKRLHAVGHRTSDSQGELSRILARLGRLDDAGELADELLAQLEYLLPEWRPYGALAEVLFRLGRSEAPVLALAAYRQAWAQGPPYCLRRELTEAEQLLDKLGVARPDLPTVDPAKVKIPFEDRIRRLIDSHPGGGGRGASETA